MSNYAKIVLLSSLFATHLGRSIFLYASVIEMYEEIRIHNKQIEARLSNWFNQSRLHVDHMNISQDPKIVKWREQLVELDFHDELADLKKLNEFINSDVNYLDDYHHFHKQDYLEDPETAITEGGDCEDIALVKAATLQRFGWPADRMHLLSWSLDRKGQKRIACGVTRRDQQR